MMETPATPPNADPRVGAVQILQKEHWDHVLYGVGQTFDADGEEFFADATRVGQEVLCSLKDTQKFSDKKEFHCYGVGITLSFGNPDNYELWHWNLIKWELDETIKFRAWADRFGAGGGLAGFDVNTGAHRLNWGDPSSSNLYWFSEAVIIFVDRTFKFISKFTNKAVGYDPLALLNADEDGYKLFRLTMVGREYGDIANR
jgi:hypothetical protein